MPYDPAIPLLGIHTEETRRERDTCTPMFISALFIIARTWKQPRCPLYFLTLEWYDLHIWGCWYFSWQSWLQLVIHTACQFAWIGVKWTQWQYTALTHSFPKLNQPVLPRPVLSVVSWLTYRCLRREARWSGIPMCLRIFHSCDSHNQKL